jgi:hypothetical protein
MWSEHVQTAEISKKKGALVSQMQAAKTRRQSLCRRHSFKNGAERRKARRKSKDGEAAALF